jgi:hypothetical protein
MWQTLWFSYFKKENIILDCKKLRLRSKAMFHILSAEISAPWLNGWLEMKGKVRIGKENKYRNEVRVIKMLVTAIEDWEEIKKARTG